MSEQFTPPKAELGQVVFWYPHGNASLEPHAALVSKLGHDSLCVNLIDPGIYNFMLRDGVRHISDPRARQPELIEQGAWDHTPATRRLQELEAQVRQLVADLGCKVTAAA